MKIHDRPSSRAPSYHGLAKTLHWLMALLIIGLIPLGLYMQDLPLSPQKLQLYSWHKWAGVTVFVLLWVRVAARLAWPPPPLPWQMSRWQQQAAHAGHLALYLLMLAIPLSGWLMSSAKGVQTVWFGILPIPDLIAKDKALGAQLAELHALLNWTLMAVLAAHVAAALKHHWIDRDDVLTRMLPSGAAPLTPERS
jgi:cytochrome b561